MKHDFILSVARYNLPCDSSDERDAFFESTLQLTDLTTHLPLHGSAFENF